MRLSDLIRDLSELPEGIDTPVSAGLLVADVLRCVGWREDAIAAAVGFVPAAIEAQTVEPVVLAA